MDTLTPSLYHISEEPGITLFQPRPDANGTPRVWAIGSPRLHNYYFPRDCPRVTFYATGETTSADRERFLEGATAVVAIESAWFDRCRTVCLSVYEFESRGFSLIDDIASYYTSSEEVCPVAERRLENPLGALFALGVEVRILPSLWQLRESVAASSLGYSIIRMRNASPRP